MINVETRIVENSPSPIMDLSLGLNESMELDNLIAKILDYPYKKEEDEDFELEFEHKETIFLMNLARKIGKSGIRKYIE